MDVLAVLLSEEESRGRLLAVADDVSAPYKESSDAALPSGSVGT